MDFDEIKYVASKHAVDSYIERTRNVTISFEDAEVEVLQNLSNAEIIIENDYYRYLKYGSLYYPCGKIIHGNKIIYRATTTLTRKMLEEGDYFDEALERYTS